MKYGGARRAVNACGTTDKLAGQLITLTSELDAEKKILNIRCMRHAHTYSSIPMAVLLSTVLLRPAQLYN